MAFVHLDSECAAYVSNFTNTEHVFHFFVHFIYISFSCIALLNRSHGYTPAILLYI